MFRRNIAPSVREALADTPVVLINGARQTGKSTLAQWLISGGYPARYITLDDATMLAAAQDDPAGRVVGIEVKAGATVRPDDLNGLRALSQALGERFRRGVVLYTGSESVPFGPRLHALPLSALWELGAQSQQAF